MALTDNILAYWKLDNDGSGAVSLVDSTSGGYTLTNNGSVTLGAGKIEGCGEFNNTSWLQTATLPAFGTSDFSVSAWINPDFTNGFPIIFNTRVIDIPDVSGLTFGVSNGQLFVYSNDFLVDSAGSVPNDTWSFVTLVRSEGGLTVYLNGTVVGTGSVAGYSFSQGGASIAGFQEASTWYWDGRIDEVGVWGRALSAIEISELYNSGVGNSYPFVAVYFNAAVNGNLATLGNWWQDSGFTIPSVSLPTSTDFVVISAPVTIGTGTYGSASINANIGSAVTITASSMSVLGGINSGTLVGSTTLLNSASNAGTISGNATLRNSSTNSGTISGNATVYYDNGDGTKPIGGIVTGTITYIEFPVNKAWFSSVASGTNDGNFNTIANWWLDSQLTIPANVIPSVISDIVIVSSMTAASGSPVVNSITIPSGGSTSLITLTATNGVYIIGGQTSGTTFYTSGGSVVEDSVGFISRLLKLPWFINI
jgi:hypothetical protein